ncbi:golgin subfamily A member 1 isoform X1 [Zootoca vivipara]|uniref:golgin subfamily A member 1 isoform X1 n=1 Tax=Zootoca vivipara TaxID=8524 RepID=UPI00159270AA|nr:golgin subfamily A member 1 isoform X1 [Zootoca vivipara]XP_034968752.1 golgin subfamily A member 1 isoform X1 [Zootoca vivipara]XP_034968753.1 golgin subfamily A member 1 isoform X1 [Zootoca vivipara]XP_034968754.1 golgin subfamily A member 1 isoform X1 [Zootoca vivipara]
MFAKLKKKLAEEAATSPRPGGVARMPRSVSKESITSVGADSGDDFPSDGSSSREDLSSQLFRRNEQIRKLEVKLSDYAEQVRNLQKIKEKLENALETHQDSFVKKLQEQNEAHQASTAKMAEGTVLALEKKDQEWREKLSHLEKEKKLLSAQLQEMREKSLNLFQKRDEIDELEGFQQQELAKVKHMLLKKEESLAQMEQELGSSTQELQRTREELQTFRTLSSRQATELQQLRQQHAKLEAERDELIDAEESAESKITTLEQRSQELQAYIQQLSVDLQNAQVSAASCEKRLEALQREHNSLKQEYEQHKQKMIIEVEEKSQLVGHLQEKVTILEKRFEGNLSGDEHVQELLREKSALEQRLEEARQQLSAARTSHAESLSLLETQIDKLNCQLAERQVCLSIREELVWSLQESSSPQVKDLEHALQISNETAAKSKEEMEEKELQIQKLQRTDLQLERIQGQEGLSTVQHQGTEQVGRLQEQMATLEAAQETERMAAHQTMSQLEKENEELKGRCKDLESSLRKQESELERLKAELSRSAETTQALEETRGQREHQLQQELVDLTVLLNEKDLLIAEKAEALLKAEEELKHLRQDYDALLLQMDQLQSSLELCQHQAMETEAAAEKRMSALQEQLQYQQERLLASEKQAATLELTSAALKKHLCPSEDGETEPNGEVAATDIVQLQKENRDMEQQIAEKNKTIKQLQQRMAELKKTLQKELKMRPDGEVPEVPTAALTVTNNSDLNDSREINFEYLKHVVLKFMSCRESEAFHLIKAMSVLLNFSQEEENMLKETLEYKMSWFGSKPSPRGSIRPSISSPRTPWS